MIFKNFNFILSALLAVALTAVLVLALTVFGELKEQRVQTASLLTAVNQRVGVASSAASDFLKAASKDMLLLQSLLDEEESGATWSETGIQKFMEHNSVYEELYLFGVDDGCLLRALRRPEIVSLPCGDVAGVIKNGREEARKLSAGELFSSPLLKHEGVLSLVYAMAIKDGRIIVAVVSAENFLEEVRRLTREDEIVFLVDREGGYLAHPNKLKEKLLGATDNFYTDFPDIEKGALENESISHFDTEGAFFSFWRIRPAEADFALYQGTRNARSGTLRSEEWILVAVSEKPK